MSTWTTKIIRATGVLSLLTLSFLGSYCHAVAEPLKGSVKHEAIAPTTDGFSLETGSLALPAGIEFSKSVDPVGPQLRLHKLFSSISLPSEDKEDIWYKIPSWRAGLFARETQTDHTIFGDFTSVSKAEHVYGMQVDKRGGIWHHMSWPHITKITLDGHTEYKIINRYEPISLSSTEFCVKLSSTDIDVDDKTGKIIGLAKQEEFDRYFPGPNGTAIGDCLLQGYSMYGGPNTTLEKTSVEESTIQPFKVINTLGGKNLRESFRNFLQSHDMAELLPDEPK